MFTCKYWKNKIWAVIFGMILLLAALPQVAMAADSSLKIEYEYDGTFIEGAQFDLYHVANLQMTKSEEFQGFEGVLDETDSARKLADYVNANEDILPVDSVVSNEEISLPAGIYLVIGHTCEYEGVTYKCAPFLVVVLDEQEVVYPKVVAPEEYIDITVTKIWNDHNNEAGKRAEEVVVELLQDGKRVDTVTLSDENDWTYRFTQLSGFSDWDVEEVDVPEGYEVTVESELTDEGKLLEFEIINTYEEGGERPPKLPQTGMLKWPVPVLAGLGLLFFMIGWEKRQREE